MEAVKIGPRERVIPILVTALAAGLALIPIALGRGEPGSDIQAHMALVILFGLMSSTILNMLAVPAAWLLVHRHPKPLNASDALDDSAGVSGAV